MTVKKKLSQRQANADYLFDAYTNPFYTRETVGLHTAHSLFKLIKGWQILRYVF